MGGSTLMGERRKHKLEGEGKKSQCISPSTFLHGHEMDRWE